MRLKFFISLLAVFFSWSALAQVPPPDESSIRTRQPAAAIGTPPEAPVAHLQQMKNLIKTQVRRAIDGNPYPALREWKPLTQRQKFDYFLHSTYAPRTFANAAIDVVTARIKGHNDPEYETGMRGWGQHYGIELATSETDVFFGKFLYPTLLKQDPRYFRNPELPFFKRALYSMSRVLITRTDSGGQTLNTSRFLASASSRALSDLYVPGQQQGMRPLLGCISFNLLRDAGMNLVHEFWPDARRKFLHR